MAGASSEFSQHLSGSYYMNPRTGQIVDMNSGQVFQNSEELRGSANSSSMENQGAQGGGSSTADQATGVGSSLMSAYLMQQMLPGGAPAAAAPAATATPAAGAPATTGSAPALGGSSAAGVSSGGGATSFATAEAAQQAGYEVVGTATDGGVLAVPSTGTPWFDVGGPSYAGYLGSAVSGVRTVADFSGNMDRGADYAATRAEQGVARTVGDYFTGGLASLGEGAVRAVAPHFMDEVDKFATKYGPMGNVIRAFGSKKDKDQQDRDSYRKNMRDFGFFNQAGADPESDSPVDPSQPWLKRLRSGAELDFGKDGGARLQNAGTNIDGKTDRRFHDVDFSQANSGELAAALNPLALAYGGGREKGQRDEAGYLVNLVQQKGDPWDNVAELYQDADYNSLRELINESDLEQDKKDAAYNTIDDVYGVNAYAGKGTAWERKGLSDKAPAAGQKSEQPKPVTSTPAPAATMGTTTSPGQIAPRPAPQLPGRPAPGGSVAPQQTGQPMRRVVMGGTPKEQQIYKIFKRAHG